MLWFVESPDRIYAVDMNMTVEEFRAVQCGMAPMHNYGAGCYIYSETRPSSARVGHVYRNFRRKEYLRSL